MPTQEERRRAIGASLTASRTGGSATQEQRRQSIGTAMTASRTGADVVEDIHRLAAPEQVRTALRVIDPAGPLPPQRGRGVYVPPEAPATGGGIASPLTEKTKVEGGKTVPDADFWPSGYPSSDGLFVLPAEKTRRFLDADGADVQIDYANPAGVPV